MVDCFLNITGASPSGGGGGGGGQRSWGEASGNSNGGYHGTGYDNGYVNGNYDSSSSSNQEGAYYGPTGDHQYLGCLGLSSYELEHEWKFHGSSPPNCSYVHYNNYQAPTQAPKSCHKWFSSSCNSDSSTSSSSYNSTGASYGEQGESDEDGEPAGDEEMNGDEQDGDNNVDEAGNNEENVVTTVSNEEFDNVNGDDFVYNTSSTGTTNTSSGNTHWWNKKSKNSTQTSEQDDGYQMQAVENDNGMDDDAQDQDANNQQGDNAANANGAAAAYDPYDDFILEQCDTYRNLWLWDLSLTCKNEKTFDSCECSYAEELLFEGKLTCGDYKNCPSNCDICKTCFQLMGCVDSESSMGAAGIASTVISALTLVGAGAYVFMRRKKYMSTDLRAHLMEQDSNKYASDTDSNDSPWRGPAMRNSGLFEDYYKSNNEGNTRKIDQQSVDSDYFPDIALTAPKTRAVDGVDGESSIGDGDNSTTDGSDDSSASSDNETTLDGATTLSGEETGAQKIWLAPVDPKIYM